MTISDDLLIEDNPMLLEENPYEMLNTYYGSDPNNWGDLSNFQGDYINFGYWKDIPLDQKLTVRDRIASSKYLYSLIADALEIKKDETILEIGCGRGIGLIDVFRKYNPELLIGIDIVKEQILRTQKCLNIEFDSDMPSIKLVNASAEQTTLKSNTIDKIYSIEVAQHFFNFSSFAKEVRRILKPHGKIIFSAHFATSKDNYNIMKDENLIIMGDEVQPIQQVLSSFKAVGFDVSCFSIGHNVFAGFEKWLRQLNEHPICSHGIYQAYAKNLLDYFVITAY